MFEQNHGSPPPADLLLAPGQPQNAQPPPEVDASPLPPADEQGSPVPRRRRGPRGPDSLVPRPGHIYGLDGLRGLAILAVLAYHFAPAAVPGGFLGVDMFFVVSGFLITTLLARELHQYGRIDLARFWLRRAHRLLPALVVVVVVSVAAARVIGGDLLVAIGRQTFGALTFSTNWVEISAGASYFDSTAPLLFVNFWSLAIEEQFYLVWPFALVVTLVLARTTARRLGLVLGVAGASALAMAMIFVPGEDASRVYYGTDTHMFSLMLGAALALAWAGPERAWLRTAWWRRWRGLSVSAAVVLLLVLAVTLNDRSIGTFRGGIVLAAGATVILIAGLLERSSPWRTAMEFRPLTWLGTRSYGIYLWHWPVLMMALALFPVAPGTVASAVVLIGALLSTLLVAAVSFTVVETPIRRDGFRLPLQRSSDWLMTPWQDSRAPRLIAGVGLAVLALTVTAVLTAPDMSATQRRIESAEAELEQQPDTGARDAAAEAGTARGLVAAARSLAQTQAASATQTPVDDNASSESNAPSESNESSEGPDSFDGATAAPDPTQQYSEDDDGLLVPDGANLTAIGDSLVVTSADGLTYRFPGTTYVAKSNRQWKDADSVLEDALDQDLVRDNVIVHFGTNAGVEEDDLRSLLDHLGPARRVVLMNLYGRFSFTESSNAILDDVAAEFEWVTIGDWHAAAGAQPRTLQSDGIHPDIEGMHVYAEVVAHSFDTLARGEN